MEAPLKSALKTAIECLGQLGYRYAVIGGISVSHWGEPRYTHDVDIKVLVPNTEYGQARAALRAAFPESAHPNAPNDPLIVAVKIEGVTVDFLLAMPGYEELIIEHAVQVDLDGFPTWICSAEDLLIQKVVAGRGKDWLDVESLLIERYGRLDQVYVTGWLEQFAEALEQPNLLVRYREMQAKVERLASL